MNIKTKSEKIEKQAGLPPIVGVDILRNVSQYRRGEMEAQIEAGLLRESNTLNNSFYADNGRTKAGNITSTSKRFLDKKASEGSGAGYRGSGGTVRQNPDIYSPLWLTSNLNMPRTHSEINKWCRAFFAGNPYVKNSLSLHSTYPISKLSISCKDEKVEKFFRNMAEETDLLNVCCQIALEYFVLGEAFVYAELDSTGKKWSRFVIQNPDYVVVEPTVVAGEPAMYLKPDENLIRIINSKTQSAMIQRKKIPDNIIQNVRKGENIPLSNFNFSHLANKISPYEARGTSIITCIFKQLMLFDKLRENRYVQADNMMNPLTLVKIGSADFKPGPADLEAVRNTFEEQTYDKDFKIFTHDAVTVEKIGSNSGIMDDSALVTQLVKEMYVGLMVPSVVMDGGSDTTYSNGGVALDVLKTRYMQFRNMLSDWLRRKIFAPISLINGFYEVDEVDKGYKKLIVPTIEWNQMSLFDTTEYINAIKELAVSDNPVVSLETLYHSLGLDADDQYRKIKAQNIKKAILAREQESLGKMSLAELRALGPTSDIVEVIDPSKALPGEESEGGGGDLLGGMGGMGDDMLPGMDMPSMEPPSGGESNLPPPPTGTP